MAGTWTDALEALRRRMEELAETIGDVLVPRPEPVPVPVRGDRGRSRGRKK